MSSNPKHDLFAEFASVARAIGHPHRLELLEQLAQGERSVESLAGRVNLAVANASQHLQQLRRSGLVAARREGKYVFYSLADDEILALIAVLQRVAERNSAEVDQILRRYFMARDSLEPVSRDDLRQRARDGTVTILDVRPNDEYALGHLAGAINVPLKDLEARLGELDSNQEIVAYCRGPYCVLSFEAVAALRDRGYRARRLEDGFPEWKAAGFAVETGETD